MKKDNFTQGFKFGNKAQAVYAILPDETKKDIEAKSNTNRKEFGKTIFFLGLIGSFSDSQKYKALSEKAMGFATSLMLKN